MSSKSGRIKPWIFFQSFRHWQMSYLPGDLAAGLSLAAISIPEQMATAHLAGMPVMTGIFAFIAAAIGFAIFGANKYLSTGADSTIAPIFASSLVLFAIPESQAYIQYAALLAVMVGVILVVAYWCRLGWLAYLLSYPVTIGFMAGISCHIIIAQLPLIFDIPVHTAENLPKLWAILTHLQDLNWMTTAIGLGVFGLIAFTAWRGSHMPSALIGLGISILLTWHFGLAQYGVSTLSSIHATLPSIDLFSLPWAEIPKLLPLAFLIAIVCVMQTAAISRSTQESTSTLDKDFAGIGLGCILSGAIGSFAIDSSPPRTMIVKSSGGRSQLAALVAALVLFIVALYGGQILQFVPHAALAGVLVYIGLSIFKLKEIKRIYQQSRDEFFLCIATFVMILLFRIEIGVLIGIILSLLNVIYSIARPHYYELKRVIGTETWAQLPPTATGQLERLDKVGVFHFSGPLNFTNADYFCNKIEDLIIERPQISLMVIECSKIINLDLTAADRLRKLVMDLHRQDVDIAFVSFNAYRAKKMAQNTDLFKILKHVAVFSTVHQAIDALMPEAEPF